MGTLSFGEQFSSWLRNSTVEPKDLLQQGLIVFDANSLLDFYRIQPEARSQVMASLAKVESRFWIPHQVGLEFARNRIKAAEGRHADLKKASVKVSQAESNALQSLTSAVESVVTIRDQTMTQRPWDLKAARLDMESLAVRLEGAMGPVLEELSALRDEQDKSIRNIRSHDPVLELLDPFLSGRVGLPYNSVELRRIVEEAVDFRFPNKIPPGYKDSGKESPLYIAGDYILWRQILDKVGSTATLDKVAFVTSDVKADWWEKDSNGDRIGPHPQLAQEMRDEGGASLLLLTFSDFVTYMSRTAASEITSATVDQIRELHSAEIVQATESEAVDASILLGGSLSHQQFESVVHELMRRMGFEDVPLGFSPEDIGFDFLMRRAGTNSPLADVVAVEAKKGRRLLSSNVVFKMGELMRANEIGAGFLFSNTPATSLTLEVADKFNITIFGGPHLASLIKLHFGSDSGGMGWSAESQ